MKVIIYDNSSVDHRLPGDVLSHRNCLLIEPAKRHATGILDEELRESDVACVHATDDTALAAGFAAAEAGTPIVYFSMDSNLAERTAADLQSKRPKHAHLVHWIEIERFRTAVRHAVVDGSMQELMTRPNPTSKDTLAALAILCQGYFAAVAVQDSSGEWGPTEIDDILQDIGWVDLMNSEAGRKWCDVGLHKHANTVATPAWWRDALRLSRPELTRLLLEETRCGSLSSIPVLDRFVEALFGDGEIPVHVVGAAYRSIAGRLR
jgi:hypothetical protein